MRQNNPYPYKVSMRMESRTTRHVSDRHVNNSKRAHVVGGAFSCHTRVAMDMVCFRSRDPHDFDSFFLSFLALPLFSLPLLHVYPHKEILGCECSHRGPWSEKFQPKYRRWPSQSSKMGCYSKWGALLLPGVEPQQKVETS